MDPVFPFMQVLPDLPCDGGCVGVRGFRFARKALIPAPPFPAFPLVRAFLAVRMDLRPPQPFEFAFPVGRAEKPLPGQEFEGRFAEPLAEGALFERWLVVAAGFGRKGVPAMALPYTLP